MSGFLGRAWRLGFRLPLLFAAPEATWGKEALAVDDLETLRYEEKDGVAIVTLNRPEVHNAFDQAMRDELKALWTG